MKYIVAEIEGNEAIFVFPKAIDHDRMAEAIEGIRFGDSHNWERKLRGAIHDGRIISAGFINSSGMGPWCYGRSETLNLESRGNADTKLLETLK